MTQPSEQRRTAAGRLREWIENEALAHGDPHEALTWLDAIEAEAEAEADVGRLMDAVLDVEAGYILRPDRGSRAYWKKVVARYARLEGQPAAEEPR